MTMPEKIPVLNLEGYAINGMVKDFTMVDCKSSNKLRMSKVIAKLQSGEEVETECMEYTRAVRVFIVLQKYKDLSTPLITKALSEEMMKGITYDIDHKTVKHRE